MKKKCCHVRMLSPNKFRSKDNLNGVIDVQQYNPLIHQLLRESKIQAVIRICYHQRATRQIHRDVSSCPATQRETKWQAHGRRARKYGPATISEAQIAVSEVLGWLLFLTQQHFVAAGTVRQQQAAIFIVLFLRNHMILHTFVISLPCLDML